MPLKKHNYFDLHSITEKERKKGYEQGVKDFAKFLVDNKEHNQESMQYWVDTFLEVNNND